MKLRDPPAAALHALVPGEFWGLQPAKKSPFIRSCLKKKEKKKMKAHFANRADPSWCGGGKEIILLCVSLDLFAVGVTPIGR